MKRLILVSFILAAFLVSSLAFAQVYEVKGKKGVYTMGGAVHKYDPYDKAKDDGKIGKLYVLLPGKTKGDDAKKLYVTKTSKITLVGGAVATVGQLNPGTSVKVTYKKTTKKELIIRMIEIQ
jgi:hypothetical protein